MTLVSQARLWGINLKPAYHLSPLERDQAERIIGWNYGPPFRVYELSPEDLETLFIPKYRYHQVLDGSGDLVGYCCFGEDARVAGGDYSRGEPEVLDVGIGLRPDLVGQGLGHGFVTDILEYARKTFQPDLFRVTVADFNLRSLKTFQKLGFERTNHFDRHPDGMSFTELERSVHE